MTSKCSFAITVLVAGDGDDHVRELGRFEHGHHAEAIHDGFIALVG